MTPEQEEELKDIKAMLRLLLDHFGLGDVPPSNVVYLKELAKKHALEVIQKKG